MNEQGSTSTSGGIGLGTILFIVFLVLKLTDKIDWSWWWVSSPLWIPVAIVVPVALIIATMDSSS